MEEALNRKREVIPELKEALNRAKARAREAQAAIEQEENLGKLQNQVIWSYVEEVEDVRFSVLPPMLSALGDLSTILW